MNENISKYIEENKENILKHIGELVAIPSFTDDEGQVAKALDYAVDLAKSFGFSTGYTDDRKAAYAEIGSGHETVGILAHVDVVGLGDVTKWKYPPYEATADEGYIYGRGVSDDKGAVIMSLYAMKALMDLGVDLKRNVRLIVGTSEERQWTDMESYKNQFGEPTFGYSPDGEFPICNVEKGYCDMKLRFKDLALKPYVDISAGQSPNSIPSHAVMTLLDDEPREYKGVSVHSSIPRQGKNAILMLAQDAAERGLRFGEFLVTYFTDQNLGAGLELDDGMDTYKGCYIGHTVASPTILRLLPDDVIEVNINIRTKYGTDKAAMFATFDRLASEWDFTYDSVEITEPSFVDPNAPFIKDMLDVYASFGYEPKLLLADGASYASCFENVVCFGPVFEGEPSNAHEENESLSVDMIIKATKLYATYLAKVAI